SASAIRQSAQKCGPVPQYGAGPLRSQFVPKRFGYREHILVATSRQTNDNHSVAAHRWGDLGHLRHRMGGLESWNDALQFAGDLNIQLVQEWMKKPSRTRAAADTGDKQVR